MKKGKSQKQREELFILSLESSNDSKFCDLCRRPTASVGALAGTGVELHAYWICTPADLAVVDARRQRVTGSVSSGVIDARLHASQRWFLHVFRLAERCYEMQTEGNLSKA